MKLTISGNVPSQKNRKIISINSRTARPFLRSAPAVKLWQQQANIELKAQWRGYHITDYPIAITFVFYFDNARRHDLDNALSSVYDALTAAAIVEDDNVKYIDCITVQYGGQDKANPRVEIYIDEEFVAMASNTPKPTEPLNTAITNPGDPADKKYKRRPLKGRIVQKGLPTITEHPPAPDMKPPKATS